MHTNTHTRTDWQANKVVDGVQIMTASSVFVLILMWVCVTVCVCVMDGGLRRRTYHATSLSDLKECVCPYLCACLCVRT